ncbi:heme ABC exporter ATP-binding protein CcmA [Phenylobacterium sp.]|uniref:heme ABC exporter ATP-binding protein CcmA n=1 Tax=Phenylobacterium sp. TaxID=1871053 RepID=UPI002730F309|nr:heme ABC exporter ATP-binding protein CcmA [Phenylobacterium sp.]MDP1873839.1 heme ABC exporter ATP-binding protein CcmA [Phenylobacterium sp.]MDP3299272.1 heme ABC exporter ATP-binding protein CcmA [Phenylobacterium sp.]MDP3490938.1 heme ABC exporter ATP-binding protein CcmA [Phenylobacterium sp.]
MISEVSIQSLALSRGGRQLFSRLILRLGAGEAVALTGRNGAGKTSLLRAIAGLIAPDEGVIAFGDIDPTEAREAMHLLGHLDGLKSSRTARDELSFWTGFAGGADSAVEAAAARLELLPLLELEVRRLSAGQRRRLALARLLAAPRPLWLLDEPLSPLDAEWRTRFGEIMGEHLATGGMILAAVHDPLPLAARTVEIGR